MLTVKMLKYHKKQCVDTLELLKEAQEEVFQRLADGNTQEAVELLVECQQGAIGLGNFLGGFNDEASGLVSRMENYCEFVYQAYTGITSGRLPEAFRIKKNLEKCISDAVNDANSLPTREEVVFLPYKAAMWDSLESVWKKAERDKDCDAYVIPIPYCDRNPDGSVKETHYEGELYPKYVPVTYFLDYDFAARLPDKIYIHNPYDEYNHVTSVDPFFYSGNLKKYTDELIYIPYFILDEPSDEIMEELRAGKRETVQPRENEGKASFTEINTSNSNGGKGKDKRIEDGDSESEEKLSPLDAYLEGLSNYVLLPGVVNADKTIVQSKEMKDCYVEILARHLGEETRSDWEKHSHRGSGHPGRMGAGIHEAGRQPEKDHPL